MIGLRLQELVSAVLFASLLGAVAAPASLRAQTPDGPASEGARALEAIPVPPLDFNPPEAELREVAGVPVLYLRDPALPLVSLFASFEGGYAHFERDRYAAGLGLANFLRYGGTADLPPDSVDTLLEHFALQTSVGSGGGGIRASLNALVEHADTGVALLASMLREPRFAEEPVEVWRLRELESVRRRQDNPSVLAVTEFNRLLYGDHPVGWEMAPSDLEPARLATPVLRSLHQRIVCPDNLVLGITGDLSWARAEELVGRLLEGWSPCAEELPEAPIPEILERRGVYLIPKDLEQSVVVMAHPSGVRMADEPAYYSTILGNAILGSGGFSSRMLARVRTEEGYAYSASSLWTTPRRYDGLVGALTRTGPGTTVAAARLLLDIFQEAREAPPTEVEVGTARDRIVNGFVFNFDSPAEIVSRRMYYVARDLPRDWLERYLAGIGQVTPASILEVFRAELKPDEMAILIVGDPDRIGREELETLGPVTVLELP